MKKTKKILSLFLVGLSVFVITKNTSARIITINEVSEEFNQSSVVQLLNKLGGKIKSQVNENDHTLDIYKSDSVIFSAKYGDYYLEYNNRDTVINEENYGLQTTNLSLIYSLATSILKLSGHEDKTLTDLKNSIQKSDNYNIDEASVEIGDYNVNNSNGKYVKYFKVPLETEKIDAILNNLTSQSPEEDNSIKDLVPYIEIKEITENSVSIYTSVSNNLRTIAQNNIMCFIYRSDNENGNFEKISNEAIDCTNPVEIMDNNLKSNTTYYYKAIIDGGENFSNVIKATTIDNPVSSVVPDEETPDNNLNSNDNNTTNQNQEKTEETFENPDTGSTLPIIIISTIAIGSLILIKYANKKNLFNKL